jgi:hypothetical protein
MLLVKVTGWDDRHGVVRIAGRSMIERIDTGLVLAAWHMACTPRQPKARLLFHSDRGVR